MAIEGESGLNAGELEAGVCLLHPPSRSSKVAFPHAAIAAAAATGGGHGWRGSKGLESLIQLGLQLCYLKLY